MLIGFACDALLTVIPGAQEALPRRLRGQSGWEGFEGAEARFALEYLHMKKGGKLETRETT